jgi:cation diffusion facilitator CzcD-associated flavoprotein CzcO
MESHACEILIVGAGFAGIGMAISLQKKGFSDIVVLERSERAGGTWRDNIYPGAACDVPSHLYSFSFEPNPRWSRMYSVQEEIFDYMTHCIEKYGLEKLIHYRQSANEFRFDQTTGYWFVTTDTRIYRAKYLINALGPLNRAVYPDIEGFSTFEGKVVHSSHWDSSYDFSNKKIAVIGTGASAIQLVPQLVNKAASLTLFQRTAPWVIPKDDREMKAWEKWLFATFPIFQLLLRWFIYWKNEGVVFFIIKHPTLSRWLEKLVTRFWQSQVKDPIMRAKIKPDFRIGCKRILPSNNYYKSLNNNNLSLICESITSVDKTGITTSDGKYITVDAIVCCTGFNAADFPTELKSSGIDGRTLAQQWQDGPYAYLGTVTNGFPNSFFLIGPNTGLGSNSMIFMMECQFPYIVDIISSTPRVRSQICTNKETGRN